MLEAQESQQCHKNHFTHPGMTTPTLMSLRTSVSGVILPAAQRELLLGPNRPDIQIAGLCLPWMMGPLPLQATPSLASGPYS